MVITASFKWLSSFFHLNIICAKSLRSNFGNFLGYMLIIYKWNKVSLPCWYKQEPGIYLIKPHVSHTYRNILFFNRIFTTSPLINLPGRQFPRVRNCIASVPLYLERCSPEHLLLSPVTKVLNFAECVPRLTPSICENSVKCRFTNIYRHFRSAWSIRSIASERLPLQIIS